MHTVNKGENVRKILSLSLVVCMMSGFFIGNVCIFSENVVNAQATEATTPSAPEYLQATAGDELVTLEWFAPVSTGGTPITNYRVYRGTTSQEQELLTTSVYYTWYIDSSVTNGLTYYYSVSADNSVGEGDISTIVRATPTIPTYITCPSPPRGLQAVVGDGKVKLSWTEPSDDGGRQVTGYHIFRRTSSTQEYTREDNYLATVPGDVLNYTDSTITNNQVYYYWVIAYQSLDGGGSLWSAYSNEVRVPPESDGEDETGDDRASLLLPILGIIIITVISLVAFGFMRKTKIFDPSYKMECAATIQPPFEPFTARPSQIDSEVCTKCGSRNLTIYEDGSGFCHNCKNAFM